LSASQGKSGPLTLLHTADLHVGSDVYAEEALFGLDNVIQAAQDASVDAVLIAGDLFDSHRVPPKVISYVFDTLADLERPVVLLPGNHDTLLTSDSPPIPRLPDNVRMIQAHEGELVTLQELGLGVWGRPVYDHAPDFHPLAGFHPRPDGLWYVAIAHGLVMDGNTGLSRSSPIQPEELATADCDYIALGHVHRFRDVTRGNSLAFYSGAPSGTRTPTVALVTMDPGTGVSAVAHPLPYPSTG
jgi:DNA repair exonuclease SbcCD nuclease subunit